MSQNIGDNIRRRRIELKITQEELAEKMGYKSKSTINKIELGINDVPQKKIVQFAKALDIAPRYLMGWEDKTDNAEPVDEDLKSKSKVAVDLTKRIGNDTEFAEVVKRLHYDKEFFELSKMIYDLDNKKLQGVKNMLSTFLE